MGMLVPIVLGALVSRLVEEYVDKAPELTPAQQRDEDSKEEEKMWTKIGFPFVYMLFLFGLYLEPSDRGRRTQMRTPRRRLGGPKPPSRRDLELRLLHPRFLIY